MQLTRADFVRTLAQDNGGRACGTEQFATITFVTYECLTKHGSARVTICKLKNITEYILVMVDLDAVLPFWGYAEQ